MEKTLRDLRIEKGWFQRDIAEAIKISAARWSIWETGRGLPEPPMVPRIADHFGITPQEAREACELSREEFLRNAKQSAPAAP